MMQNIHFKAPNCWINDPNGFIWYKGQYHLFYQCFPYAPQWGRMHWGHAVSKDLVNWEEKGIALNVLGDLDGLPVPQRTALRHAIRRTEAGQGMVLNLALNYGGRGELVRAVQAFLREGAKPEDVTEQSLAARLYTAGQPDPDLLIRTSGEQRLSNYLLYQCAYSELYFTPVLWPDFDAKELHAALQAYAARSRRFGKTEEQLHAH